MMSRSHFVCPMMVAIQRRGCARLRQDSFLRQVIRVTKMCASTDASTSAMTDLTDNSPSDESNEADLINKKRNKSRLNNRYHTAYIKKEMPELIFDWELQPRKLRRFYATYGKQSGLNPRIMWPSKEELDEMKEFEREFETPVQDMMKSIQEKKNLELEARRKREEDVLAKFEKLDMWIQQFKEKKAKKLAEIQAQKAKKERMIEEVREFLGYNIDPKDAKFQEVLEQKELEEKKAKKAAKKKEQKEKMLAKLLEMAPEQNTPTTDAAKDATPESSSKT